MTDQIAETMPYSKDIEEGLVASVMINPQVYHECGVMPDDFYLQKCRWLWESLASLVEKGVAPDVVMLVDDIERRGLLETAGGVAYISHVLASEVSSLQAVEYARRLKDYALRRKALAVAQELACKALDTSSNIEDAVGQVYEKLSNGHSSQSRTMRQGLSDLYDNLEQRSQDPKDIWGIPTGWLDYDYLAGGLHQSELVYLTGKPGLGKSRFLLQTCIQMARAGYPGVLFNLEMSEYATLVRAVAMVGKGVSVRGMKTGKLTESGWSACTQAINSMIDLPLLINDAPGITLAHLRSELAVLRAKHKIQWFGLDYIMLMGGMDNITNETDRTGRLSAGVRNICRQLNLAGVVINSVTKDGMDSSNRASLAGMRGSGQMIHDADVIIHMIDDDERPQVLTLITVKGREFDQLGRIELVKIPGSPAFGNAEVKMRVSYKDD
jgi:replicative DNA helicase